MVLPLIIGGGLSLLGGILSSRSDDKRAAQQNTYNQQAYQQQLEDTPEQIEEQLRLGRESQEISEKNKYKWIVEGAQEAGFNPLTALRSGGGSLATPMGTQISAVPASQASQAASFGENLTNAMGTAFNLWDPIGDRNKRLQNELLQTQIDTNRQRFDRNDQGSMSTVQKTASPVQENYGSPIGAENVRPVQRPHPGNQPRVLVYLPNGAPALLLKNVADREGVTNYDTLSAGGMAELVGEITGEVFNTLSASQISQTLFDQGILVDGTERTPTKKDVDRMRNNPIPDSVKKNPRFKFTE